MAIKRRRLKNAQQNANCPGEIRSRTNMNAYGRISPTEHNKTYAATLPNFNLFALYRNTFKIPAWSLSIGNGLVLKAMHRNNNWRILPSSIHLGWMIGTCSIRNVQNRGPILGSVVQSIRCVWHLCSLPTSRRESRRLNQNSKCRCFTEKVRRASNYAISEVFFWPTAEKILAVTEECKRGRFESVFLNPLVRFELAPLNSCGYLSSLGTNSHKISTQL